jgi:NAD(P)H-quinone oxidoreductase subunit 5
VAVRIALMPFQSWLLGTVEAPTPLSALMHAGVVNAGGLLVILAAPLSAAAPAALDALLVLGLVSAVGGPLAMWAQTDLKRSLAWSTVGQMGFMAVQCGLGAYAAALLHLVGHGCYKANAFLRSGTLERAVEARPPVAGATVALAGWAVGTLVALAALAATYRLLGADPATLPGGWTLVAVQALAVGQVLASPAATALGALPRAGLVVPAAALYAALTWTIEHLLHGHVAAAPALADRGAHGPVLAVLVPAALAALTIIWVLLPRLAAQPWALAFRVHAGNGFYLPLLAERLLRGRA